MEDQLYQDLVLYLSTGDYPPRVVSIKHNSKKKDAKKTIRDKAKGFLCRDGMLFKDDKKVLRKNEISSVLQSLHAGKYVGGHLGRDKTYFKCQEFYYWKGMKHDVEEFVKNCDKCCRTNLGPAKCAPPLNPIPVPCKVWSLVGIDIVGPLPITAAGNKYIVAATDHFSKWSEAAAIPEKSAHHVSKFLLDAICRLGPMDAIISDQGKEFTNKVIDFITDELDIDHRISSAYHPQTNGQRERDNRTLKEMLTKTTNKDATDWDSLLQSTLFAYRTSVHASTKFSPFEVMYGRKPRIVKDFQRNSSLQHSELTQNVLEQMTEQRQTLKESVLKNIGTAQEKQKRNFDQRHKSFVSYPKGSFVLMKNSSKIRRFGCKLAPRWVGPYKVLETLTKGRVKLQNTSSGKILSNVYHSSHLKLYKITSKVSKPASLKKPKTTTKLIKAQQNRRQKTRKTPSPTVPDVEVTQVICSSAMFKPPTSLDIKKICKETKLRLKRRPSYGKPATNAKKPTKLHHVKGDGNCLFRALSYALTGSEEGHTNCRQQVISHMRSKKLTKKLSNYLNQNVDQYINKSKMEHNATWATDAEILGAAALFNLDVYVYSANGTDKHGTTKYDWLCYPASFSMESTTECGIYLQNLANDHFNVVLAV